jgi:hypothetical protein
MKKHIHLLIGGAIVLAIIIIALTTTSSSPSTQQVASSTQVTDSNAEVTRIQYIASHVAKYADSHNHMTPVTMEEILSVTNLSDSDKKDALSSIQYVPRINQSNKAFAFTLCTLTRSNTANVQNTPNVRWTFEKVPTKDNTDLYVMCLAYISQI